MDPLTLLDVRTLHEERVAEALRQQRWRATVMSVSDQRGGPWPQFVAWLAILLRGRTRPRFMEDEPTV